ncbi:MAG: helix-turn-helix transcriptional regulator [Clostridia bacterium]|nr:helix-turn-helix transcriptional regulator [Clostridia bacterium]
MSNIAGIKFVFHETFTTKKEFEISSDVRPWSFLLFVDKGAFAYESNGRRVTVEADEAIYISPTTPFKPRILRSIKFHQIGFLIQESNEYTKMLRNGKLSIPKMQVRSITASLDRVTSKFPLDNGSVFTHVVERTILEHFLHAVKNDPSPEEMDSDVAYVVQYMTDHISEKIKIEALAEELHISHVGLLWKFKRTMGCTPSDFLIQLRMRHAKHLLMQGKKRINEIALLCGYNNAYYFSNAFKKVYHIPPSKYRDKSDRS